MSILVYRKKRRGVAPFLQFTTQPGTGGASPYTVSPAGVVTAKNADGTTQTGFVGTVTLALVPITGSPVPSGTLTKVATAGAADFTGNGLTVTGAGTYQWVATSPGYSAATSSTGTTTSGFTSITDSFTAADGTNLAGRTTDTGGKTWVALQGTFKILTNQAAPNSTVGGDLIVVDTGVSDGTFGVRLAANVTVTLLAFRVTDSANYWRLWYTGTILLLQTVAAGVATNRANVTMTVNAGDIISATCSGNTISASVNGVQQIAPFSFTYNTTATEAGLLLSSGSASARWDDFSVTVP